LWKWLSIILLVILFWAFPAIVLADVTEQDVTVTATPAYGIISFAVDYVSDYQIDLSWVVVGDVDKVMVRAKYGSDLAEIPDEDTEPSDGYLVYYGDATSATHWLNMETMSVPVYFKIWGQKADTKWYTGSKYGLTGGETMILIGMFVFAGILSFLAFRSSFKPMRFVAGFSWVAVLIYWIANPPAIIPAGSATHIAVMMVLIFAAFVVSVSGFGEEENRQRSTPGSSRSSSVFNLRKPSFMASEASKMEAIKRKREEDNEAYRNRVHGALRPRGEIRRR
jgi:hypothetical protein